MEKILSESEPLPPEWSVDGTTGYDFLAAALVLPASHEGHTYTNHFTGERVNVVQRDGQSLLLVAEVLGTFPVALLSPEQTTS